MSMICLDMFALFVHVYYSDASIIMGRDIEATLWLQDPPSAVVWSQHCGQPVV